MKTDFLRAKGRDAHASEGFLYRKMEEYDDVLLDIGAEIRRLRSQHQEHREAIADGAYEVAGHYDQLSLLPDLRQFPVSLTRRGGLITRDIERFAFLYDTDTLGLRPHGLRLSESQLAATAQWDMLPTLELPRDVTQKGRSARLESGLSDVELVDQLAYRAVQRTLNVAKRQRVVELRAEMSGLLVSEVLQELQERAAQDTTGATIDWRGVQAESTTAALLVERMVETTLTRLGEFTPQPLRLYQPKVGTDLMAGIDLYARYGPDTDQATMVGFDVTTSTHTNIVTRKKLEADAGTRAGVTIRDPRQPNQRIPMTFAIVDLPSIRSNHAYEQWQHARGNSAVTPEFFLRYDHRRDLATRALERMRLPDGSRPLADPEEIMDWYYRVYGPHETRLRIPTAVVRAPDGSARWSG